MKPVHLMAQMMEESDFSSRVPWDDYLQLIESANQLFLDHMSQPLRVRSDDKFYASLNDLETALSLIFFLEERLIDLGVLKRLKYIIHETKSEGNTDSLTISQLEELHLQLRGIQGKSQKFIVKIDDQKRGQQLIQSLYLYQFITEKWNEKDLQVASHFVSGMDYRQVAAVMGRDDSSTWRRERSLGIKAYKTCKELIFSLIK